MTSPLRIAVVEDEREMRDYFGEVLPRLGYQVVVAARTGRELLERGRSLEFELLITDIKMPELDGIDLAAEVNRTRRVPVLLVSAHHDDALLSRLGPDFIMGYLVKPVSEADLKTSITVVLKRFQHFVALIKEASDLRQALEDRKVVERAKGVIMKRLRVDEDEAFRRLRKMASDHNLKLLEVGQRVIHSEDVFAQLDRL